MPYFRNVSINETTDEANAYQAQSEGLYEESLQEQDTYDPNSEFIIKNTDSLLESYIIDIIDHMSPADKAAYLESDEFSNLQEAGVVGRRSMVRLNKESDLKRRTNLAALQAAKEAGDANWEALRKNRIQERRLLDKIYATYGNKVRRDAIQAQRRLIKLSPNAFSMIRDER